MENPFLFFIKVWFFVWKYQRNGLSEKIHELYEYVIELKNDSDLNESDRQVIESIIERIRTGKGLIKKWSGKDILCQKGGN